MSTKADKISSAHKETEEERRIRDERFVEKFFTERELIVKYDDTSESHEKNAHAWYEAVGRTMNTLPTYQHDNVGQPLPKSNTPKADSTSFNKTNTPNSDNDSFDSKTESHVWFFRGQKDARFAFTSTLYRRLSDETHYEPSTITPDEAPYVAHLLRSIYRTKELEKLMINAEINLLNKAREIGIGRGLTALETLTLLQHHGSPTRLIDVTSDWKVALYFACESDEDRDGRIFLIKTESDDWKTFPKEKNETKQTKHLIWEHFLNIDQNDSLLIESVLWSAKTWPILLPFSDPRMISQRGFFLVGGIPIEEFANKLPTRKCPDCNNNRCRCPDRNVESQSMTSRKEVDQKFDSPLTCDELRKITSLAIQFEADEDFLDRVTHTENSTLHTAGYSIRIPKEYKRTLIDILRRDGVHKDSIYPPLRETVRLFEHVVDESFKQ
jgi:FRG domain protein